MKEKYIVADTNVWYNLANGNDKLDKLLKKTGILCSTNINLLEISHGMDSNNYNQRRAAAKAVVERCALYLPDSETFLKQSFNFSCSSKFDFKRGFQIIANSNNLLALINGYFNYSTSTFEYFNIGLARAWRNSLYRRFFDDICNGINSKIPNYINKIEIGKKLPKIKDENELNKFDSYKFIKSIIYNMWLRMKLTEQDYGDSKSALSWFGVEDMSFLNKMPHYEYPTDIDILLSRPNLLSYAYAYVEYLKYLLLCRAKPQENDAGDLENFLFLRNDDYILATADKKWIKIGQKVCPKRMLDINSCI